MVLPVVGRIARSTRAVEQDLGLGSLPLWPIKHLIDAGKVDLVLEDFEPAPVFRPPPDLDL
ncbi:hypothetical protein [Ensifer sp. B1-9]|uniref:hypothetical protein n=1 Tax=Ensifer sp. B1-9 TaxID=3141455 RepID=UPI003D1AD7D3